MGLQGVAGVLAVALILGIPATANAAPQGYAWSLVAKTDPPQTMHPGEKVPITVALRNDGTETWHSDGFGRPSPVRLAATAPRDRASLFASDDPSWMWSGGTRVRMSTPIVPPGGTGIFTFTFTAPALESYPQSFEERFAPVAENATWMDDHDVVLRTTVRPVLAAAPPIPNPGVPGPLPVPEPSPLPDPDPGAADIFSYRVLTSFRPPAGELVRKETQAFLYVPVLIDVDGDFMTGIAGHDVIAQMTIDLGRATLRVTALPGAPSPLPLQAEAVIADPRQGSDLKVFFGYDALADTAPQAYDATITLVGADRVTSFSLDLHTVGAGTTLGVTAGVFREGANGERLDPQRGRIDYAPVPTSAHFGVLQGEDFGIEQSSLDLVSDTPTRADVLIEDVSGGDAFTVRGTVDKIPNSLTLVLTDSGIGQTTYDYSASAVVDAITLEALDSTAGVVGEEFALRLQDMPTKVTLVQDSPTHATLQTSAPIGVLEAGLAEGGRVKWLADPAYLHADDSGGIDSLAFRILGLEEAELDTGDPLVVDATLQSGPLHIRVVDGSMTIEGWVRDLPSHFRIEASTSAGTLSYEGSDPIAEIAIDATDPAGLSGRATLLHVLLRDIPTTIEVTFGQGTDALTLDTLGQSIGLIELLLTSGPDERIDPAFDGLLLRDLADRYVVFGRLTGLKKVVASAEPPDVQLETVGGRILKVDLEELTSSKVEYVRATLDRLQPVVRVRLVESGGADRIIYTASGPTNSISFDTNSGSRWNLHADMGSPLPANVEICQSSDGACVPGYPGQDGSLSFRASEHTTINVFDCQRPADASCPSNPSRYIQVSNLRVQDLDVANETHGNDEGYLYLNTNSRELTGFATYRDGDTGARITLPGGFWAQNRLIHWEVDYIKIFGEKIPYDIDVSRSGAINCPGGTHFEVRVPGLGWLDVTHGIEIFGIRIARGIC